MNTLIIKVPNKRYLQVNNKIYEIDKQIAKFLFKTAKNLKVEYVM